MLVNSEKQIKNTLNLAFFARKVIFEQILVKTLMFFFLSLYILRKIPELIFVIYYRPVVEWLSFFSERGFCIITRM